MVASLADRGGTDVAEYNHRCTELWTLIEAFNPRDAIDVLLTGQIVAFNEVLADGAQDLLRGMSDTLKQRCRSSLVAMGRLAQGNIDRLEKRGLAPYRTEDEKPAAGQAREEPAHSAPAPADEPPDRETAATQPAEAVPTEASWLDEPYQEWLLETPADIAFRQRNTRSASHSQEDIPGDAPPDEPGWHDAGRTPIAAELLESAGA